GKYPVSIELNVLDEKSLRQYADDVGVQYNILTDTDNLSGIVIQTALASGEKLGDITSVYMNPNEQLELFYYDWDTDEELYVDNVEIAALTDKRPIGVDLSYVGNVHVIISQ